MKLEHIAVAANTEEQADRFFVELLGLKVVGDKAAEHTCHFFSKRKRHVQLIDLNWGLRKHM